MNYAPPASVDSVRRELVSAVRCPARDRIEGFVYDALDLDARWVVELHLDGQPVATARAHGFDPALLRSGIGDGCYRYVFAIEAERLREAALVEVRLANLPTSLGSPAPPAATALDAAGSPIGEVTWRGGLRFFGWLEPDAGDNVRAFIDGACVASARVDRWVHVGEGRDGVAKRGFAIHLPAEFADGRLRQASFIDALARPLEGSPCPFFAFADGLAQLLEGRAELESEKIRGRMFDEIFPRSAPFEAFAEWRRAFSPKFDAPAPRADFAVAIIGEQGAEITLTSLEAQTGVDCIAGVLPRGAGQTSFVAADLAAFLDEAGANCRLVAFALAGATLHSGALARLADCWRAFPDARLAYGDVTVADDDGQEWPIAFPAFDYERMLEQGYGAYVFAMTVDAARQALAAGADNVFRLFNATMDDRAGKNDGPAAAMQGRAVHTPGFLARLPPLDLADGARRLAEASAQHLRARRVEASVEAASGALFACARVRRSPPKAKVSILVPTRDRVDLLRPCIESLGRTIDLGAHELFVIDNDSRQDETLEYFASLSADGARIAHAAGSFNFARLIGAGASLATGDFLLLLNNDVEARREGWLEEMLGRAAEPDVGAVGALLLWPSGVVQHGGVTLGVGFAPAHAFADRIDADPGYADLLGVAHECSAVTGACLLTPRRLFQRMGGLDGARFPVNYNDIDYCLRLRAAGYRIVVTPHARLTHRESASRGVNRSEDATGRYGGELRRLRALWGETLLSDPAYSPLLALDGAAYAGLAWPPRPSGPRLPVVPGPRAMPPGF